jgi:hypothetical protein
LNIAAGYGLAFRNELGDPAKGCTELALIFIETLQHLVTGEADCFAFVKTEYFLRRLVPVNNLEIHVYGKSAIGGAFK